MMSPNVNYQNELTYTLSDFESSFRAELPPNPKTNPVSHRYNDIPGEINKASLDTYFSKLFTPAESLITSPLQTNAVNSPRMSPLSKYKNNKTLRTNKNT